MAATASNLGLGLGSGDAFGLEAPRSVTDWRDRLRAARATERPFGRPLWRGRLHAGAFTLAVPAGVMLAMSASQTAGRIAAATYALTLTLVFGTSAMYHCATRSEQARVIMQKLDHSMIYLLIAGTFAPLCLVALPPQWGIPLLGYLAGLAVLGIVLTVVAFHRARRLAYALYLIMASTALVAAPLFVSHLSGEQLILLTGGAVAYALGTPVLMRKRPDPWPERFGYHEIFHVSTIVASLLHFAAIADLVA